MRCGRLGWPHEAVRQMQTAARARERRARARVRAVLVLPDAPAQGQAVSQPSPDERLRERLAHLPRGCRAILTALEQQAARGGGDVKVVLHVGLAGELDAIEIVTRYARD